MNKVCDIDKEIKKAENPYEFFTEEMENYRGQREDPALVKDFLSRYRIFKNEDAITDPDTLMRFAQYASEGSYDMLYCDDDVLKDGSRIDPFFKPGYSPENVLSFGRFFGLCAVRNYIDVGLDHWYLKLDPKRVRHIPEVLCHYLGKRPELKPVKEDIFSGDFDFRIRSLSIIILSKDHPRLLEKCVRGLSSAELPDHTELIVVDNGSSPENRAAYRKILKPYNADYLCNNSEFNYSALNNYGEKRAMGDYLLFLNDDIEIPEKSGGFIKMLMQAASRRHAGAVGMKLLYPDGKTIQHCGVTLLKSGPSHKLCGFSDEEPHYFGVNEKTINVLAVTGACLCIKRRLFEEAGGFDENLPVAYNDVELCVRLYERGLYNICINNMFLIHHESASRKDDTRDPESYLRMKGARDYFYEKHRNSLYYGDPFYHSCLTFTGLDYTLNVPLFWEESGIREEPLFDGRNRPRLVKAGEGLKYNIDSADYRLSDAYLNEDFFEISGWIFFEKQDVKKYEPGVMISLGENRAVYRADRVYRKDVRKAFPKQKRACMAGFYVRVSRNSLDREGLVGDLNITPVLMGKNGRVYIGEGDV